jgi:CRISPR-associated protein Csm1
MEENDQYRNIYTVYAGGDDLFLISDWETAANFAFLIQREFSDYVCQNKDVTISAGINLAKARYPIRRGVEEAENFLRDSKDRGRNRITLFHTTVEWKLLEDLEEFRDFLEKSLLNKESRLSKSFLRRLLTYHQMFMEAYCPKDLGRKGANPAGVRFQSKLAYDIGRNITRKDRGGNLINQEEVEKVRKLLDIRDREHCLMRYLKVPVHWVLTKHRYREEKEHE